MWVNLIDCSDSNDGIGRPLHPITALAESESTKQSQKWIRRVVFVDRGDSSDKIACAESPGAWFVVLSCRSDCMIGSPRGWGEGMIGLAGVGTIVRASNGAEVPCQR
jgi:hypothetical protein